eukprot:357154-Chlamydomonas_euryale.AAC.3
MHTKQIKVRRIRAYGCAQRLRDPQQGNAHPPGARKGSPVRGARKGSPVPGARKGSPVPGARKGSP